MKGRKNRLYEKRAFILLVAVAMILGFYVTYSCLMPEYAKSNPNLNIVDIHNSPADKISIEDEKDKNENYNGVGQEIAENQEGYFTTFTTGTKNQKIYKEYKQNGDAPWSSKKYWGGTMEENGCGITALAIILSGYDKDFTPEDLRKKYYPVLDYENLSRELYGSFGVENSDFYYDSYHLSAEAIEAHLKTNRPVLICLWSGLGENPWTEKSHYMVLLATDDKGKVYVSNPNGLEDEDVSSGWYDMDKIIPYLFKALYVEEY